MANKIINGINLDFSDVKEAGETRPFTITGTNGAVFSLEIQDSNSTSALPTYYNLQTRLFQTTKTKLNNIKLIS